VKVWTHRTSYYPRLFDEVLESLGVADVGIVKELVALYHQHRAEQVLFEGVHDMLGRLRSRFSLFLITDGNAEMQRAKIESLGLEGAFDEMVLTGSYGKAWSKPALLSYRRVLEKFGGDPAEYLYVGDNPACDFYGAKQLGMRTVRVLTQPFCEHEPPDEAYAADFAIDKTTDLEQRLT
jgi:putative hydrolase of the HAD superfamily